MFQSMLRCVANKGLIIRNNWPTIGSFSARTLIKTKKGLQLKSYRPFEFYGSPSWTRTNDKRINSPLLYQLSYQGMYDSDEFYTGADG